MSVIFGKSVYKVPCLKEYYLCLQVGKVFVMLLYIYLRKREDF